MLSSPSTALSFQDILQLIQDVERRAGLRDRIGPDLIDDDQTVTAAGGVRRRLPVHTKDIVVTLSHEDAEEGDEVILSKDTDSAFWVDVRDAVAGTLEFLDASFRGQMRLSFEDGEWRLAGREAL